MSHKTNKKNDTVNEATIKLLVDSFYNKIRRDKDLAPIFEDSIGTTNEMWKPHLERMYLFWSSIMLSSGSYHGNPMQKHKSIPSFQPELFDRWLALFEETARELHTNNVAEIYVERSKRIAKSLKLALYYKPERKNQ